MQFQCARDLLNSATQIVAHAVSPKSTVQVLSGIHLQATTDKLILTATDFEIGIQCSIPVKVIEEGSVVIPAKYGADLIRRLPEGIIDCRVDQNNHLIRMNDERSDVQIHGYNPAEYPGIPHIDVSTAIKLKLSKFQDMIKQVVFAVAQDETRPLFTGVLFDAFDKTLALAATDGARVAVTRTVLDGEPLQEKISFVIPGRALQEVLRIYRGSEEEEISCYFGGNQVMFQFQDTKLISALISGQYPAYENVFPKEFRITARVRNRVLMDAVERASLMARDNVHNAIKLNFGDQILHLNSNSPDIGRMDDEMEIERIGDKIEIVFNARYLADMLKVTDSDEVMFHLNQPLSQAVITPYGRDDYKYLILPLRSQ